MARPALLPELFEHGQAPLGSQKAEESIRGTFVLYGQLENGEVSSGRRGFTRVPVPGETVGVRPTETNHVPSRGSSRERVSVPWTPVVRGPPQNAIVIAGRSLCAGLLIPRTSVLPYPLPNSKVSAYAHVLLSQR